MLFTYLQQVLNGEFTFYQFYMKRLLHNVMKSFENQFSSYVELQYQTPDLSFS